MADGNRSIEISSDVMNLDMVLANRALARVPEAIKNLLTIGA